MGDWHPVVIVGARVRYRSPIRVWWEGGVGGGRWGGKGGVRTPLALPAKALLVTTHALMPGNGTLLDKVTD